MQSQTDQKDDIQHITHLPNDIDGHEDEKPAPFDNSHIQIQALDKLTPFQAAWRYRRIGFFCFLAAFSAALDGFQGELTSLIVERKKN